MAGPLDAESPDFRHDPVLLEACLELLAPVLDRGTGAEPWAVDCTLGLGGHAEAILSRFPRCRLLGIDRDPQALARASARMADFGDRFRGVEGNFHGLEQVLGGAGLGAPGSVTAILADLGVSSLQLDDARRGFSFQRDGPLDMRMGGGTMTARDLVNSASESELERIFRDYGEEPQARRVARAIAAARGEEALETTGQLRAVVHRAKGFSASLRGGGPAVHRRGRRGRGGKSIDPATRVFQALRIEVNQELEGLEGFLEQAVSLLEAEGRLVVISYHSLEDRIVKHRLRALAQGEKDPVTGRPLEESRLIELLTRRPLRPSEDEVTANPRSRSARLRAASRRAARRISGEP